MNVVSSQLGCRTTKLPSQKRHYLAVFCISFYWQRRPAQKKRRDYYLKKSPSNGLLHQSHRKRMLWLRPNWLNKKKRLKHHKSAIYCWRARCRRALSPASTTESDWLDWLRLFVFQAGEADQQYTESPCKKQALALLALPCTAQQSGPPPAPPPPSAAASTTLGESDLVCVCMF